MACGAIAADRQLCGGVVMATAASARGSQRSIHSIRKALARQALRPRFCCRYAAPLWRRNLIGISSQAHVFPESN